MSTTYEFQSRGVLKTVNNIPRGFVEGPELTRLLNARQHYSEIVATEFDGQVTVAA
jgi:hypothetical protein